MLFIEIEKAEAIVKITEPTHLSLQTVFLCFNTGISSQKCIARDFVMQTLWSTLMLPINYLRDFLFLLYPH